jgi:hypothetical protein
MKKYLKIVLGLIKHSPKSILMLTIIEIYFKILNIFVVLLMSFIIIAIEDKNPDSIYFYTKVFIFLYVIKLIF